MLIETTLDSGRLRAFILDDGIFITAAGRLFGPGSIKARIKGALHPILVLTGSHLTLLDSGFGPDIPDNLRDHYELNREQTLMSGLQELGYSPKDISRVILSHMDADHTGWALSARYFPNATVYVQQAALDEALSLPPGRSRHEHAAAAEQAVREGWCELLNGDGVLTSGIRVEVRPGHAAGHQVTWLESGDEAILFTADLAPSRIFLNPDLISSADSDPETARRNRIEVLSEAEARRAPVILYHELSRPLVKIQRTEKGFEGIPYVTG